MYKVEWLLIGPSRSKDAICTLVKPRSSIQGGGWVFKTIYGGLEGVIVAVVDEGELCASLGFGTYLL